jgi:hypothetical protein
MPTSTPYLYTLTSGRFGAVCGRCMTISPSVADLDAPHAWSQLVAMGWTIYVPPKKPRGHARCARCAVTPWSFDQAVEQAKKARKRKSSI